MVERAVKTAKKERAKQAQKSRRKSKTSKLEKQTLILIFVLVAILVAFISAKLIFMPLLKKPYFDFHGFKVYRVMLEGTNMLFYSIPTTFSIEGTTKEANVVLRYDPKEIEKTNMSIKVDNYFFRTRPQQLWITMGPDLKADVFNSILEIKKFADTIEIPSGTAVTYAPENKTATLMNCDNSTYDRRVILFKLSNETKIYANETFNNNCIVIEADSYESLLKASDSLVLEWLLRINL